MKIFLIIIIVIVCSALLLFLGVMIRELIYLLKAKKAEVIIGEITNKVVETKFESDPGINKIEVKYVYNGTEYIRSTYFTPWKFAPRPEVGDKLEIIVMKSKPEEFYVHNYKYHLYIFNFYLILALISIGIVLLIGSYLY